jgi:hypothetical protein
MTCEYAVDNAEASKISAAPLFARFPDAVRSQHKVNSDVLSMRVDATVTEKKTKKESVFERVLIVTGVCD